MICCRVWDFERSLTSTRVPGFLLKQEYPGNRVTGCQGPKYSASMKYYLSRSQ